MFGNLGSEQLLAQRLECGKRTGFLLAHEARVADYVCSEYGRETTLH